MRDQLLPALTNKPKRVLTATPQTKAEAKAAPAKKRRTTKKGTQK